MGIIWTSVVILGMALGFSMGAAGGLIYLLLVIAIILILLRIIEWRSPVHQYDRQQSL
jgi:predicted lipid-binding transport protein (Tim44 family)